MRPLSILAWAALICVVHAQIPPSPYGDARQICAQRDGAQFSVNGFPGTPYRLTPFVNAFVNPSPLNYNHRECRTDNHCLESYEIVVEDKQLSPFNGVIPSCSTKPTWFLTYNGKIPGPTITAPAGQETLVRFRNQIKNRPQLAATVHPCDAPGRSGRPFSTHLHGSASMAPWDGWAEDETCFGETKDYVYPNNRPVTGWYHDHALHITSENANLGLAGMYIVSSKQKNGGCGEPWNLEDVPELQMILADKVLDSSCQIKWDTADTHKDNYYGDINLVSGIPFPLMTLEPKHYRMRLLNAAVSRSYFIKIKDSQLRDISQNICSIVASDGGYRFTPVPFPAQGLLIGVAERYEVVCNFANYKDQTLYIYNEKNENLLPGVPFFCHTHLVAKIVVKSAAAGSVAVFNPNLAAPKPFQPMERVMSGADYNAAVAMANAGRFHREMKFGRSGGEWTINGETWASFKIAAANVGQSTWEVWRLDTGGGWYHPVHIHLIDFFVVRRDGGGGLRSYERNSPKDVMFLGASNKIYVIARFGPHRGDYMFHCHNLRHEDNDMMRAFRIVNSASGRNAAAASPYLTVNNIVYSDFRYADPMWGPTSATKTPPVLNPAHVRKMLDSNAYRIFYPNTTDPALNGAINPWKSQWQGHC